MTADEVVQAVKLAEIARHALIISDIAAMQPVKLHEKKWDGKGWIMRPRRDEVHVEGQCPTCGVDAHFFVPKTENWAEYHKCALCFRKYIVLWEV